MTIIQGGIRSAARLLGVPLSDVDDAMRSERAAKVVLTRRNLLLTAGSMALGTLFSFPEVRVVPLVCFVDAAAPPGGDGSIWRPFNRMEQAIGALDIHIKPRRNGYVGQSYVEGAVHYQWLDEPVSQGAADSKDTTREKLIRSLVSMYVGPIT